MNAKKRKKSLVGWTNKDWTLSWYASSWTHYFIPNQKYASMSPTRKIKQEDDVKVRIIIEEL